MSGDPLLYFLKGSAFVESGDTTVRTAVNVAPVSYAALPGIVRAPLLLISGEFDVRLRAIQVANVLLTIVTGVLYSYLLSWVVAPRYRWLLAPLTFASFLLGAFWVANIILPLADTLFALLSAAVVILTVRIVTSERPLVSQVLATAAATVLFVLAFFTRYTAPGLLLFAAVLWLSGFRTDRFSRRSLVSAAVAASLIIIALLLVEGGTFAARFVREPLFWALNAEWHRVILNLFASALPSQIIPTFNLAYSRPPLAAGLQPSFANTPMDVVVAFAGLALSGIIAFGAYRRRRALAPEILYVVASLPVLALMMQSTTRYLMTFQPFVWMFFVTGAAPVISAVASRLSGRRVLQRVLVTVVLLAAGTAVYMRFSRFIGFGAVARSGVSATRATGHIARVASVFHAQRSFIESLPRERSLLMSRTEEQGRWTAISGVPYYAPDEKLTQAVAQRDVYLLVECGTVDKCVSYDEWRSTQKRLALRYGNFAFDSVFATGEAPIRVETYRLRLIAAPPGAGSATPRAPRY